MIVARLPPFCPSSTPQPSSTQITSSALRACMGRHLTATTPPTWISSRLCPYRQILRCLACMAMQTSPRTNRRQISCSHLACLCKVALLPDPVCVSLLLVPCCLSLLVPCCWRPQGLPILLSAFISSVLPSQCLLDCTASHCIAPPYCINS